MPITIGAKRESDFTDPIGMLGDCHRRIERFLNVQVTLATREKGGPLTEEHRAALETSLRYFREAAPKHTADEEESLFPLLRRIDLAKTQAILARIDSLEQDHELLFQPLGADSRPPSTLRPPMRFVQSEILRPANRLGTGQIKINIS
jgi:iron-sulfur cluster repair protein YtfE (RIC family)